MTNPLVLAIDPTAARNRRLHAAYRRIEETSFRAARPASEDREETTAHGAVAPCPPTSRDNATEEE